MNNLFNKAKMPFGKKNNDTREPRTEAREFDSFDELMSDAPSPVSPSEQLPSQQETAAPEPSPGIFSRVKSGAVAGMLSRIAQKGGGKGREPLDSFEDDLFDDDMPSSGSRTSGLSPAQAESFDRSVPEEKPSFRERFSAHKAAQTDADIEAGAQGEYPDEPQTHNELLNTRYSADNISGYRTAEERYGYTPPTAKVPVTHLRYKRRNRHPMKQWLKTTITVCSIALFFTLAIVITFTSIIKSRVNYVGDSTRNKVYLTVDEQARLYAEESQIEENVTEFTEPAIAETTDEDVKIIMLVASDALFGSQTSSNCDALMLLVIDERFEQIKMISVMTELYARIPGYYSNTIGKAFYYDTAKGDYTLPTLRQTVETNLGVVIDNYVIVDYKALETLVNRLGGVTLELNSGEAAYMSSDSQYGYFPRFTNAGKYTMSGAETLNYVRMMRIGDGTFERTQRQRKVLYELIGSLKELSFIEISELTYAMLPLLPTDMTKKQIWEYYKCARDFGGYSIDQMRLPIEGAFRFGEATVLEDKFEVLVTNYAFTAEALRDYIYDNDTTYQNGANPEDIVLPSVAPLPEMLADENAVLSQ